MINITVQIEINEAAEKAEDVVDSIEDNLKECLANCPYDADIVNLDWDED